MPENKKSIFIPANDPTHRETTAETRVADVPITRATELFNEYELEDGNIVRVKNVASSVLRLEGKYTEGGDPVYVVVMTPEVTVVNAVARVSNIHRV